MSQVQKNQIRKLARQQRQNLSPLQQDNAAKQLLAQIQQTKLLQDHQHLAFYLANDGEINPQELINFSWDLGKTCYLPILKQDKQLRFASYQHNTVLYKNRLGILEPQYSHDTLINIDDLDILFMPLVAFDQDGHRLGRGAGFYDRTLTKHLTKPLRVGLAHELQKKTQLPIDEWDINMHLVITDQMVYRM